jgi:hypothetical protein
MHARLAAFFDELEKISFSMPLPPAKNLVAPAMLRKGAPLLKSKNLPPLANMGKLPAQVRSTAGATSWVL